MMGLRRPMYIIHFQGWINEESLNGWRIRQTRQIYVAALARQRTVVLKPGTLANCSFL